MTFLTLASANAADFSLRQPPAAPTIVKVGFYLSEIISVNEQQENFQFEGRLIATWRDPRQAFDPALTGTSVKTYTGSFQFTELYEGWWPQFVLANESGFFEEQAIFLKVQSDGEIHLIREISALAEMPLDLHRFPFDRQHFTAKFLVLGHDRSEVRLESDLSHTGRDDCGVQIAQWNLKGVEVLVDDFWPHLEGDLKPVYSRMVAMLDMERRPHFMPILRLSIEKPYYNSYPPSLPLYLSIKCTSGDTYFTAIARRGPVQLRWRLRWFSGNREQRADCIEPS